MIYLGNAAVSSIDIVSLARPFMEKLKEETNETISLFIRKGFKKICIAKVESDLSIRYSAKIGEANYLHGGASGNILMAGMTKKELDMLESTIGFPKLTEHTVIDRGKIERILDKTRKDGYWVSYKERRDDTAGIGVPIFNHLGQIVASLNITLPSTRFDEITVEKWIPILKKAGLDISRKNGYYENFAHDSGHLL